MEATAEAPELGSAKQVQLPATAPNGRAALRPGLALGLGLADLDDGRAVLAAQVGLGPGGPALVALRVAYDLRAPRSPFR